MDIVHSHLQKQGKVSHRGMRQVHHEPAAKGTDDEVRSQLHLHCQLKQMSGLGPTI